jgi:NADH:ubiquinone oxidoreductase subunit E
VSKLPSRSPTHEEIEIPRLASMGLEIEDVADGDHVSIRALVELAEDRGRPPSHYLAAVPLGTELRVAGSAPLTLKVCAGNCQRYGALDLLDQLVERWQKDGGAKFNIAPVTCLDRCDQAPAAELDGPHGKLVLAPASAAGVDEALANLA